jgi:hypothetical protein
MSRKKRSHRKHGAKARNRWRGFLLLLAAAYLAAPVICGVFAIGDRDGPVFYPIGLHAPLHIVGHEARFGEKPGSSFFASFYRRPPFWGMDRRPRPAAERIEILENIARREKNRVSELYERLSDEHQRIEAEWRGGR